MTDKTDSEISELAEKLREKILERMPPGGTRKNVKRIVEKIILGDDDLDEDPDNSNLFQVSNPTQKKLILIQPSIDCV
jgi:hypothetical protein